MKGLVSFIAGVCCFLAMSGQSLAIDFKVKGAWHFAFDYVNGGNFMNKSRAGQTVNGQQWSSMHQPRDSFEAYNRMHWQLDAVASENLAGTVFFEIGEQRWGMANQGGALGADGAKSVKVKQAYLDWRIPNAPLKLRMGLQGMKLPGFALDSPVFQDDVAGIAASWKISPRVAATAIWMRPANDNWIGDSSNAPNYMDNFDLGAFVVPVTLDGFKITPWGMAGGMGPNTIKPIGTAKRPDGTYNFSPKNITADTQRIDGMQLANGLFPATFTSGRKDSSVLSQEYSSMYWGGLTWEWTSFEPFSLKGDFIYGAVDHGREYMNRSGWFGMLLADHAFDWAVPGIYGWYFSGDDDNPHNGSERLPYIATTNNASNSLSSFGYRGSVLYAGGKGILGTNPSGTWGVGTRLKDISFVDDLSHIIRLNFFGGTNDTKMASYITGRQTTVNSGRAVYRNMTDFNAPLGTYLTTSDTGLELNLDSTYKAAENLNFVLELGYIHLWLDKDVWGGYQKTSGDSLNYKDAWKATLNITYSF